MPSSDVERGTRTRSDGADSERASLRLFAHARSGSSSLLKILQSHAALRVVEEPFHEKFAQWNPGEPKYVDLITDVASLERQLDALFAVNDGIKVLGPHFSRSADLPS